MFERGPLATLFPSRRNCCPKENLREGFSSCNCPESACICRFEKFFKDNEEDSDFEDNREGDEDSEGEGEDVDDEEEEGDEAPLPPSPRYPANPQQKRKRRRAANRPRQPKRRAAAGAQEPQILQDGNQVQVNWQFPVAAAEEGHNTTGCFLHGNTFAHFSPRYVNVT